MNKPPFFNVIIHKDDTFPDLHGVCAGFESRQWRKDQLVDYLFEYLAIQKRIILSLSIYNYYKHFFYNNYILKKISLLSFYLKYI